MRNEGRLARWAAAALATSIIGSGLGAAAAADTSPPSTTLAEDEQRRVTVQRDEGIAVELASAFYFASGHSS